MGLAEPTKGLSHRFFLIFWASLGFKSEPDVWPWELWVYTGSNIAERTLLPTCPYFIVDRGWNTHVKYGTILTAQCPQPNMWQYPYSLGGTKIRPKFLCFRHELCVQPRWVRTQHFLPREGKVQEQGRTQWCQQHYLPTYYRYCTVQVEYSTGLSDVSNIIYIHTTGTVQYRYSTVQDSVMSATSSTYILQVLYSTGRVQYRTRDVSNIIYIHTTGTVQYR